ncbi:MAG: MFS transporter [Pseudomonadota bacterium]|nr:MFS transporter [Pseudomonadota bacterium]MEC9193268.1 MFS transporter [Pseudomonadota bacterium]MEC9226707.1 MFS transporter [Pseudomonadota bacterium]
MSWLSSLRSYFQPRVLLIAALGVLSGLPLGLLIDPLRYWLSEIGIEKSTIGLLSLVMLSYSLKMFWAPLVDRLRIPYLNKIGQRKSWLILSQFLTFFCILAVGFIDPSQKLNVFVLFVLALSFFSATQDICVDAMRIELVDKKSIGEASAVYIIGYRLGAIFLSQVITFYIADAFGWSMAYFVIGSIFILSSIFLIFVLPEPTRLEISYISIIKNPGLWFKDSFILPLSDLISRYKEHLLLLLFLTFTYRLSDMFLGPMAMPFYQEIGFTKLEVAQITNFYGMWMTIIGGLFAGLTLHKYGLVRNMIAGAIFVPLANIPFIFLNILGKDLNFLIFTITVDNFSQGFISVVGITFLSNMVSKTYTATQYALLFGLVVIPPNIISSGSGFVVESYGFQNFFILCALLGLPAIIFSLLVWRKRSIFGFD